MTRDGRGRAIFVVTDGRDVVEAVAVSLSRSLNYPLLQMNDLLISSILLQLKGMMLKG